MSSKIMINVTKTFTPPIDEYIKYLNKSYDQARLTNRGELVTSLEKRLVDYLGVNHLTLTTNGTLPIQIAIKALELKGEILTTPFSYIATTSSILWENCTPVFVDIDEEYFTIDATKIEDSITPKTSAILATHVFGNPCDVASIAHIAKKHNLKVIYDAAHCFGVKYKGRSIFNYGDVSTCSFHATKVFHTGEGGCFITNDEELHNKMYSRHNFGHISLSEFSSIGINAKMSELQAAMGHAVLDHVNDIFNRRESIVKTYDTLLSDTLKTIKIRPETEWNYHYYPVLFNSEEKLLETVNEMNKNNIYPRRYFYPSLNTLEFVENKTMPISESISKRILCLPLYHDLSMQEVENITKIITA